jgi:hypothetical protein
MGPIMQLKMSFAVKEYFCAVCYVLKFWRPFTYIYIYIFPFLKNVIHVLSATTTTGFSYSPNKSNLRRRGS